MTKCERCKKEISSLAVSPDAFGMEFSKKMNEALLELMSIPDAHQQVATLMLNVDDALRPMSEKLKLSEFYRKWADLKEQRGE